MTTPIIPVIVVAERALYNIMQEGSDTDGADSEKVLTRVTFRTRRTYVRVTTETYDVREGEQSWSAALSSNLYKNTDLQFFRFQVSPHSCIQQVATSPRRGDYSGAPMIRTQAAVGVCGPINTNW